MVKNQDKKKIKEEKKTSNFWSRFKELIIYSKTRKQK